MLSGGVFQNRTLLAATAAALEARGLRVLVPERLPPNDGGVSYGQAAVAAARDPERRLRPGRSWFELPRRGRPRFFPLGLAQDLLWEESGL